MTSRTKLAYVVTILALILSATLAVADPPSRVARLQYTSGQISVQPGGVDDWVEASVNRPLTTADRVWADKESRAELHLGGALMRIDSETSVTLTNVSDQTVQVELDQGTLNVRVRHLDDDEIYEVDTPNLAFTITKSGEYRFDVDPNNDTTYVTVWKGRGEATGEGRAVEVNRGEQAKFTNGTSLDSQIFDQPDRDGFDDFCRVRDRRLDESQSARYVSPDVIGAEDLDQYGTWRTVPAYGAVWMPAVAPGWAPYHYGHWVWVDPWGWTWVDDAPWGFAPAHYGRWVYYDGGWGWVPGPPEVRPVYAPALVAWVGGSNWGISITSGEPVGWVPLGYGEPYIPPYGVSRGYFQQVNVSNTRITNINTVTNNYYKTTNVTNITNVTNVTNVTNIHYANARVPGAVMAVPKSAMVSSQPVARNSIQIPPGQLKKASFAVAPSVAPDRDSVIGARGGHPGAMPPARVMEPRRPVVSHVAPPPRPVPFEAKQEALAAHPGRPLDQKDEQQIRAKLPQRPAGPARVGEPAAAQHENEGLHRGQQGTQPSAGFPERVQPNSNIRVNGRVPMPPAAAEKVNNGRGPAQGRPNDEGRPNNGRGQENQAAQPAPAGNGRYVPRPPSRSEQPAQAERNAQAPQPVQTGRPVARPMDTRGGQNESPRNAEPAVARPGEGRVVEQPGSETRTVARPPQGGSRNDEHPMNSSPANNGHGQGRPAAEQPSVQERNVPRPPDRGMSPQPAPAPQAAPAQPRNDSAPNRGNSAPARDPGNPPQHGNSGRDQGNSNYSAPRQSQPEYRPVSAPQQTVAPAAQSEPARSAPSPSKGNSHSDDKGKSKDNH